jgi:large subunit ribosomal protein L5
VEKVLAATSNSNVTVFDVDLYDLYLEEARPKLKEIFNYKNDHEIPKITKIIVNQTYPEKSNLKGLNNALNELSVITAQKGVLTRAKKSIAGFGITKGDPLGLKVTLRRKRMYGFLHRLIHLSFPRIRDFRGLNPLSFDGFGNYTFGVEEQLMFPEMNPESAQSSQGLHISIVTSAKTNKEAYFLLKLLGMPFQKNEFWDSSAE